MFSSLRSPKNSFRLPRYERCPLTLFSLKLAKCDCSNSSHSCPNLMCSPGQPILKIPNASSPSLRFQILLTISLLVVFVDSKRRPSCVVHASGGEKAGWRLPMTIRRRALRVQLAPLEIPKARINVLVSEMTDKVLKSLRNSRRSGGDSSHAVRAHRICARLSSYSEARPPKRGWPCG